MVHASRPEIRREPDTEGALLSSGPMLWLVQQRHSGDTSEGRQARSARSAPRGCQASPAASIFSQRWAGLFKTLYPADPLLCARGGDPMRIIASIDQPGVIEKGRKGAMQGIAQPPQRESAV